MHRAERRAARQPARVVHAGWHFALPQAFELRLGAMPRETVCHAATRASAHQRKHEAGTLGSASIHARAHLECPMKSVHDRGSMLVGVEGGPPDQRCIAEHPQVTLAAPVPARLRKQRGRIAHDERCMVDGHLLVRLDATSALLDQLDLVAVGIGDKRDHRGAAFDRAGLARDVPPRAADLAGTASSGRSRALRSRCGRTRCRARSLSRHSCR